MGWCGNAGLLRCADPENVGFWVVDPLQSFVALAYHIVNMIVGASYEYPTMPSKR